jgi:hypothetical protein
MVASSACTTASSNGVQSPRHCKTRQEFMFWQVCFYPLETASQDAQETHPFSSDYDPVRHCFAASSDHV